MKTSRALFERAKKRIAGGVNSPVRAFSAVGGEPVFFARGEGPFLFGADGERYIDYVCSWGALIHGHAHPQIVSAAEEQVKKGLGFGAPTELECEFAEAIARAMPVMEKMRAVSSGTEAAMSALRLARGFSGREKIIKFAGCYHGHSDSLLVAAGSGALTFGAPSSAGVTEGAAKDTVVLPYNDAQTVADAFARRGNEIAAVIVEPIAGNMNLVIPSREFLIALRELCDKFGAVLIFDEVMTGFRVSRGGAQQLFNVRPDLCCLGKVVGGGLPAAVFGGRADIMKNLAPGGDVYQAGTLSGNPLALAAGLAALRLTEEDGFYESLAQKTESLTADLNAAAEKAGVHFCAQSAGGMFGIYFRKTPPQNFAEAQECDSAAFAKFHQKMLARGIYLAPSQYEASFLGSAHAAEELTETAAIAAAVLGDLTSP